MIVAPRPHVLERGPAGVEHGQDVGAERALQLGGGDVGEAVARHLVGGVVDEDVDAAELLGGPVDEAAAVVLVLEVAGELERGTAGVADDARRLVGVALLVLEVGDRDVGALASEGECDRAPDPRVAAGDHRLAAFQPAGAAVGRLAEVGRLAHLALEPGMLELIGGQRARVLGGRVLHRVLIVGHGLALPMHSIEDASACPIRSLQDGSARARRRRAATPPSATSPSVRQTARRCAGCRRGARRADRRRDGAGGTRPLRRPSAGPARRRGRADRSRCPRRRSRCSSR